MTITVRQLVNHLLLKHDISADEGIGLDALAGLHSRYHDHGHIWEKEDGEREDL